MGQIDHRHPFTSAAEVARIKADYARRRVEWTALILARLAKGNATTSELALAARIRRGRVWGVFGAHVRSMATLSLISRAGTVIGPTKHINIVWTLPIAKASP